MRTVSSNFQGAPEPIVSAQGQTLVGRETTKSNLELTKSWIYGLSSILLGVYKEILMV